MITTLLLALAPALPQSQFDGPRWQLVDGVAMQIGDRAVLFSELESALKQQPEYATLDERGLAKLRQQVMRQLTDRELEIQAGENEGFDPVRIAQIAQQQTKKNANERGAAFFADELRAQGASVADVENQTADSLYSQLWRSKQLGTDLGFSERMARDRYIRPGMLKSIFRVSRDMINPGKVELRFFVLDSAAVGGDQAAEDYLNDVKERVQDGEDFGEIIRGEASEGQSNGGLQPSMAIPRIAFPELREFALKGEIGSFGPLVRLPRQDRTIYLLARLEDRQDQVPPNFEDGPLQYKFRRQIRLSVDDRLLRSGHDKLRKSGYLWVHPALLPRDASKQP